MVKRSPGTSNMGTSGKKPGASITSDWSIAVSCKFYNGTAYMLTMVDNHTTGFTANAHYEVAPSEGGTSANTASEL